MDDLFAVDDRAAFARVAAVVRAFGIALLLLGAGALGGWVAVVGNRRQP